MQMSKLKPLAAIALVIITVLFGFFGITQWIVLLLSLLFTAAYVESKWAVWKPLVQRRNAKFYQSLLATYVVETILVFALYWSGRLLARLFIFVLFFGLG